MHWYQNASFQGPVCSISANHAFITIVTTFKHFLIVKEISIQCLVQIMIEVLYIVHTAKLIFTSQVTIEHSPYSTK